jgi:hypothetical protein
MQRPAFAVPHILVLLPELRCVLPLRIELLGVVGAGASSLTVVYAADDDAAGDVRGADEGRRSRRRVRSRRERPMFGR